jgi:hypothetical protein
MPLLPSFEKHFNVQNPSKNVTVSDFSVFLFRVLNSGNNNTCLGALCAGPAARSEVPVPVRRRVASATLLHGSPGAI